MNKRLVTITLFILLTIIGVTTWGQPPYPNFPRSSDSQSTPSSREAQNQAKEQELIRQARQKYNTARRLESRGDFETALRLYQDLYKQYPENRSYFEGVRDNLLALERYKEAIDLIQDRIAHLPPNEPPVALYAALGEVYYITGEEAHAEYIWKQTLQVIPGSTEAYLELSHTFIRLRLIDRAIDILVQARKDLGDPLLFASTVASLHQSRMNWNEATKEYLLSLRETPNRKQSVLRSLANFPDDESSNEAVRLAVEEEIKTIKNSPPWTGYDAVLYEILAGQYMKNSDYSSALVWIEKIDLMESKPGQRLIEFAAGAHNEGADSVAHHALMLAAKRLTDPVSKAGVDFALANLALAKGNIEQADSLFSLYCTKEAPDQIERDARLQRGLLRLENLLDPQSAIEDFQILLEKPGRKDENTIRQAYAKALIMTGKLEEAKTELTRIKPPRFSSRPPGFPPRYQVEDAAQSEAGFLQARIAWWQGKGAEALGMLDSLLILPTGADRENDALALAQLLRVGTADSIHLAQLAKADLAEFAGNILEAEQGYRHISEQGAPVLAADALWRLSQLYLHHYASASMEILLQFIDRFPHHPRTEEAWLKLGELAENRADRDQAIEYYENLLVEFQDGVLAAEARLRLDCLAGLELPPLIIDPLMQP